MRSTTQGRYKSKQIGLKEYFEEYEKMKGDEIYQFAFSGGRVDFPSVENEINRLPETTEKDKEIKKFCQTQNDRITKIDVYSITGKIGVDKMIQLLPDSMSLPNPKALNLHNGARDSIVEGGLLRSFVTPKQLIRIGRKHKEEYGNNCAGWKLSVRKKLKTDNYAKFLTRVRNIGSEHSSNRTKEEEEEEKEKEEEEEKEELVENKN